ncbi:hypothetical protein FBU30_003421 [Linnemannia zychae]|nr:hypothetical protein FBU30_003421 [Linnemannia zychae]
MSTAILWLRIWMVIVTLINLGVMITFYTWVISKFNEVSKDVDMEKYEYDWTDYTLLIASPILVLAYFYSIFGKRQLFNNRFIRAALMAIPALFLIGLQLRLIVNIIDTTRYLSQRKPDWADKHNAFTCAGSEDAACAIGQAFFFVPVIVGFFTLIEVLVTLIRGPLRSSKDIY